MNHIHGLINYVAHHEPDLRDEIRRKWNKILKTNNTQPSFSSVKNYSDNISCYIDEAEIKINDQTYLALCICETYKQADISNRAKAVLENFLADPHSDGDLDPIYKKGLHFSDATEDLKLTFVKELQDQSFRAYIAFGLLEQTYSKSSLDLLESLLRRRLISQDNCISTYNFEINNKVPEKKLRKLVELTLKDLQTIDSRSPISVSTHIVNKKDLGISTPDFVLGVFAGFMKTKSVEGKPAPREHILFERLRDKIRVIIDVQRREEFTRRNPIKEGLLH